MAYDRDDSRNRPSGRDRYYGREPFGRDDRPGFGDRERERERGYRDEDRGFFERAGDEIASWFGDGDGDGDNRRRSNRVENPYGPGGMRNRALDRGPRSSQLSETRQETRGAAGSRFDPHYRDWRDQQIAALDRDYDEYRREHQSRFENDFGSWRERRMSKRSLLGTIREHMDVVGQDNEHVGTVDRVAGDRIILTRSDEAAGGAHHSLSCADVDRIEENRIILDCTADEAKKRWRDENTSRALFEREDQGEMGPRILDRSFEGTYR